MSGCNKQPELESESDADTDADTVLIESSDVGLNENQSTGSDGSIWEPNGSPAPYVSSDVEMSVPSETYEEFTPNGSSDDEVCHSPYETPSPYTSQTMVDLVEVIYLALNLIMYINNFHFGF